MNSPHVDPADYPLNKESRQRFDEAYDKGLIKDIAAEAAWCWEEMAQLNAGIKFLEGLLEKETRNREMWAEEAHASAAALRELRKRIPSSISGAKPNWPDPGSDKVTKSA